MANSATRKHGGKQIFLIAAAAVLVLAACAVWFFCVGVTVTVYAVYTTPVNSVAVDIYSDSGDLLIEPPSVYPLPGNTLNRVFGKLRVERRHRVHGSLDAEKRFIWENAYPGRYYLRINKSLHAVEVKPGFIKRQTVTISADPDLYTARLVVSDASGEPIVNIRVAAELYGMENDHSGLVSMSFAEGEFTPRTDSNGAITLAELPAGAHRVYIGSPAQEFALIIPPSEQKELSINFTIDR